MNSLPFSEIKEVVRIINDSADNATQTLPSEIELLDQNDLQILNVDEKEFWPFLNQEAREKLLKRAHHRARTLDRKREVQLTRQKLCADYIDALCSLVEVEAVDRANAKIRYEQAKTKWEEFRSTQPLRR